MTDELNVQVVDGAEVEDAPVAPEVVPEGEGEGVAPESPAEAV